MRAIGGKKHEVRWFLKEFKQIVTSGSGLYVVPRRPNTEGLIELGLTAKIRTNLILGLSVKDFCSGPEPDYDQPGEVWIFGLDFDGMDIYIKLKIAQVGSAKIAKCISFHKAKFVLRYPFK